MATDQQASPEDMAATTSHDQMIRTLLESEPTPTIGESIDTFRRDLPEMLTTHEGCWVAYHGEERVAFGETQTELYQECFRRGLTRDDFVVCGVEEGMFDPDEEIIVSPDA